MKTEGEVPSGVPLNVRIISVTPVDIHITWDQVKPELTHGDIEGYYVGYKKEYVKLTIIFEIKVSSQKKFSIYNIFSGYYQKFSAKLIGHGYGAKN